MEHIKEYIEYCAIFIEIIGVIVIVIGVLKPLAKFIFKRQHDNKRSYSQLRQELGKAILLGLEILVVADIVATIVTVPDLQKVLVLAIVVLIRTFLSFSLEMELEGKLPWKKNTASNES